MNRMDAWRSTTIAGVLVLSACNARDIASPEPHTYPFRSSIAASAITTVDISGGVVGGGGFAIGANGLIIGRIGTSRGWWQSPSPAFTSFDAGFVYGGNRFADVGSGATVLLTTGGALPLTVVPLQLAAGMTADNTVVRDINDSRMIVGSAAGQGYRWDSPTSPPTLLLPGNHPYPVSQTFPEGISNSGLIAGWVVLQVRRNTTSYAAIVWNGSNTATVLPSPPGAASLLASNVNDAGVVSGHYNNGHMWAPIRWTPNATGGYDIAVLNLDVGGSNGPTGIDECGRITGGSPKGAWLWDSTSGVTLLPSIGGSGIPGWSHTSISDVGDLVGSSYDGAGKRATYHATLWRGLPVCPP